MIESCPKKRMLFAITFLAVLTIIVLIIESRWTRPRTKQFPIENNSTCWLREEYEIIQDCHPCTEFEINSKTIGVCIHTHNKELLRCKSGKTVTRSCDRVAWLDERNFWVFEVLMFVCASISCLISNYRQKILDRRTLRRVQRQLAQSV